tara:strand:+ start:1005 stop:1484 length:480 start_codon:yes stop_codon:yes gene_type:complete
MDVVAVAGTVMAATSAMNQASAQKDQFAYQSAVESNKAIVRDRQAVDAIERGEEDARTKKAQIKTIGSRQLVTLAGQGGDVTTGSSVDLLAETKEFGKLEEQKIRNNAARDANSIRADATNMRADAQAAKSASQQINPLLVGAATGLQGLGNVGSKWYT